MQALAFDFYKDLYSKDTTVRHLAHWPKEFPALSEATLSHLQRDPSSEEIKSAVFDMGAFKAPGPDGLSAHFFQSQWDVVCGLVCDLINRLWRNPREIEHINHTTTSLIPKVDQPSKMAEFRPISLCNVIYKILSKVITNRLKGEMAHLVLPQQCSFIKGRQGSDNIIIVQEAIHTMRTCRKGDGYVVIKVDMEKAYDRVDWGFLEFTLQRLGLNTAFIELIMGCVSTTTMRVQWQGTMSTSFKPTKGVRQGDPLSPYLFVLCMECLGQLIHHEVEEGRWQPLTMSPRGPHLSHLFFADDLVLFGQASAMQMEEMKGIMGFFCEVSDHKISLAKSKMFVSKNVHASRALSYSQLVGVGLTPDLGKYLGVPILHGRMAKQSFHPLIQRVRGKLAGWKGKFLNMAGRTVLIKSVLSSIPYYQMQTLLIPKGILHELEKISRAFLWNQNKEGKKQHLLSWDLIKQHKDHGGLGIRDLRAQNEAFVMKLCWGLLTRPTALWVHCLTQKYRCGSGKFPLIKRKRAQSSVWSSILSVWECFHRNVGSNLGDGTNTSAWTELWTALDLPLIQYVDKNIDQLQIEDTVATFVTGSNTWDLGKWRFFLPNWVVDKIAQHAPPRVGQLDKHWWRAAADGNFSVSSAYRTITKQCSTPTQPAWRKL